MGVVVETIGETGFPGGVSRATDAALLPTAFSPQGRNAELAYASQGLPYVQKRSGIRCLNRTAIAGNPVLLAQHEFTKISSGTTFHLLAGSDGGLYRKLTDNTITTISGSAFTAGTKYPSWAAASDLLFIVNGTDAKKFDGVALSNFGIVRPTVGTLSGAAGAAGSPNGTYELRVTYANSATGHESSASNTASATVALTSDKLDVSNIPVSGDSQVDTVYVYVRNIATMTQFFRIGSVANGVTTGTFDWVDANLVTAAPTTTSNDPPPAGVKYLGWHQGRMFAATETALYYSALLKPEAFDLDTRVERFDDGQRLTAIYCDREVVLIFKEDQVYVLRGDDPSIWRIDLLDNRTGCGSHRTIQSGDDGFLYWWSREGLARWDGLANSVDVIGQRLYGEPTDRVNYSEIASADSAFWHGRYLVTLPGVSQTRNTLIVPFSTDLSVFESDIWDPLDASSLGVAKDADGHPQVYLGSYRGQMFLMHSTNNDGVAAGTVTGTFVPSSGSMTTITDATATFDTTGEGLKERKVTVVDASGNPVTSSHPRPRITSNTGTAFTMHIPAAGLDTAQTYTYIIGGPDFSWDTPWRTFSLPWIKKRYEYLYLLSKGVTFGASARINMFFDYNDSFVEQSRTFETTSGGSLWDEMIWDVDVWDMPANVRERFRVGAVGFAWKARVRNSEANQPFAMLHLGVQAVTQTVKA